MAIDNLNEMLFTSSHEWLLCVDNGVKLGLTQYAQQQLGEIVFVELPLANRTYQPNQALCVIESIKTASEIDAPFACTVISVNHMLSKSPGILNSSPLTEGWICVVKPDQDNWHSSLMNEKKYFDLLSNDSVS